MKTGVIVQARTGSHRLPGKVLLPLGGKTVLDQVMLRCMRIESVDTVCIATTELPEDDVLVEAAVGLGADICRGSENDLVARYYQAANELGLDEILRVTSDCPLIDPGQCEAVLQERRRTGVDYACNFRPARLPHGVDCEVYTLSALREINARSTDPSDREHVSFWLARNPEFSKSYLTWQGDDLSSYRWTLDTTEDYRFFKMLFEKLPDHSHHLGWQDVLELVDSDPALLELCLHRRL